VLGSLAQYLLGVDRLAEAREVAAEAIAVAGQVGAGVEEAAAHATLGDLLAHLGEVDAGLAELAAAVRLATQAGDVVVLLRATINHSHALLAAGRPEEAATVSLDGLDEARRLGLTRVSYGPWLAANATEALVALGRWDQAEQVSREALETAASDPASVGLALVRATLELGRGDLDRAETGLQGVWRVLVAPPTTQVQRAGPLFCGLTELALWRGDLDQAKQLVAEAVPLVAANPRYAAPIYALGVRVEADRAELARARHPGRPAPDDATAAALLERLGQAALGPAAAGLPELAAWQATPWPSGPASRAPLTRGPGRPRWRPGSGWASPTGPPTPASATPRRCWPAATATPPRRCWAAPPPSPAASAPARSAARSRRWRAVPAWT
jgi:ATP/maltotriose-dependent transcriptional regulator MalT